jgi:hypothetical protein
MRFTRPILLATLVAVISVLPPAADAAIVKPFSPTSVWNRPVPSIAPLNSESSSYVTELVRQVTESGSWINSSSYSAPVYTVPSDQPKVRVRLDKSSSLLQAAFTQVPIPASAKPASGSVAHMVVWQPSTDRMWELYGARVATDGWHMRWGGMMSDTSTNPGYFTPSTWGATATALPLLGGMMRIDELLAGSINHALALAIPAAKQGTYVWPAQRTDGWLDAPNAIPEGTQFRLDPTLDINALAIPSSTKMIARAAQRYGMIVRDQASTVTLYAEDPTPTGISLKYAVFAGKSGGQVMASFPWDRLQVVAR